MAVLYWRLAGSPEVYQPVRVLWFVYRGRKLDDDNCLRGLKAARDELFARRTTYLDLGGRKKAITEPGRVIRDDSGVYLVEARVVQLPGAKWQGNEWICCVVYDASEEHKP